MPFIHPIALITIVHTSYKVTLKSLFYKHTLKESIIDFCYDDVEY